MKELFHASRDVLYLKSFFREGAKPIGIGEGGQSRGFYVYETKKMAEAQIKFLKEVGGGATEKPLSGDGGLIVGIKVDEKEFKYPNWQFDYEKSPELYPLVQNNWRLIEKSLPEVKSPFFQIERAMAVKKENSKWVFDVLCQLTCLSYPYRFIMDITRGRCNFEVAIWQGVFDKLCQESPDFLKEYNALLLTTPDTAKKYTGQDSLTVSYHSLMEPLPDGSYKETQLYTDAQPKERQICPFVKVAIAKSSSKKNKTLKSQKEKM